MAEQNFDLQAVHEAREAVFKFWIDRGATPQQAQQMTEQWGAQGPNKVLELTPEGRTMPPDERAAAIATLKDGTEAETDMVSWTSSNHSAGSGHQAPTSMTCQRQQQVHEFWGCA